MKAVIIAGGKGERLWPLTKRLPKPMIKVGGKPIVEHQVGLLRDYGIRDIFLVTGYLSQSIKKYFSSRDFGGLNIVVYQESVPLGTFGALRFLRGALDDDFLVVYGDLMLNFKIDDFVDFHKAKGGLGTLFVHPNDHPFDSDLVEMDGDGRIIRFIFKNQKPEYYNNLVSAGVYLLSPRVFTYAFERPADFVKDLFPKILENSEPLFGYKSAEYIKDMGTPERLSKVRKDYALGKTELFSKRNKRPAIFLDRDGTLIQEVEWLHRKEDLELFPFSPSSIKKINDSPYLAFLITNQPVVARNLCDLTALNRIHNKLQTLLGREGAYLNDIYFCPHHPDRGYPEENPLFKISCDCRKPKPGLVNKAVAEYNVDVEHSWFIGNTSVDIQTGKNAGLKTILVLTGKTGADDKKSAPDYVFDNLSEAVDFILGGKKGRRDRGRKRTKSHRSRNKVFKRKI